MLPGGYGQELLAGTVSKGNPIPSLRLLPLYVIPDLIRNLVFTTTVMGVKLEILKQVQDDRVGRSG